MEIVVHHFYERSDGRVGPDGDTVGRFKGSAGFDDRSPADADLTVAVRMKLDRSSACVQHDVVVEDDRPLSMHPHAAKDAHRPSRGNAPANDEAVAKSGERMGPASRRVQVTAVLRVRGMEHRDVAPLPAADDTVAPRTYRFELREVEYGGGRVGAAKTIVEVLARGIVGDVVHGAAEEAPRDRGAAALLVSGGQRCGHMREE